MKRRSFLYLPVLLALFLFYGCGKKPPLPIDEITQALKGVPTYSVILDDMKEEGTFFKTYSHKYRIVSEEGSWDRDWQEVPKDYFERYLPFLGMTIYVKQDGKGKDAAGPPGYEYVNNSRYGRWETDSSGRSFWVFYGQYRLLSDFLGPGPIYRNYYDSYYSHRGRGIPYYGPHREYGTNGSYTKRSNPNFYSRRQSQKLAKEASFSKRVNQRIGRTKTSVRGRSGRAGK
jgi:hypothetical protein